MPLEAVLTCIGQAVRQDLTQRMEELDPTVRVVAVQLLEALPQCANNEPVGIRFQETDGQGSRSRKGNRRLSKYNIHMRDCLKAGGNFQSCVQQYRDKKARGEV